MRVKKGQLRRWNQDVEVLGGRNFLTVSSRIIRDRERDDLGWGERGRGEILWTILEDGNIVEDVSQMDIHASSDVIDETG
jgi:hypothetical protein